MRILIYVCLLLVLSACATLTQESRAPTSTPGNPEPPVTIATSAPTATQSPTPPKTPRPAVISSPESSVILQIGNEIRVIDLRTGEDAAGYEPIIGYPYVVSPDMKIFATIEPRGRSCEASAGGVACRWGAGILDIVDLQARRVITNDLTVRSQVTDSLPSEGWVGNIAFSPDVARLAFAYNVRESSTILLADARTAQIIAQRVIEFRPSLLQYAQDGRTLAVYGEPPGDDPGNVKPPPPRVMLLDATTLKVEWEERLANVTSGSWCVERCNASHEERLSEIWYPAVTASKDARQLYIVHADADKLTTVDFSARTIRTVEIQTTRSWFENFLVLFAQTAEAKGAFNGAHKNAVLSPDGTRLYVSGIKENTTPDPRHNWETAYTPIDLQMIDVASGRKLASRVLMHPGDGDEYFATVNLTADARYVFVYRSGPGNLRTDAYDARNLQPVARLDKWRVFLARRMDGQMILMGHQPNSRPLQLAIIDPGTFEVVRAFTLNSDAGWVSP